MNKFRLIKQLPKNKEIGIGALLVKDNIASFMINKNIVYMLERIKIDFASSIGIELSGYERKGNNFIFQKWWLIYEQ
jgi:hypothetical protein